MPPVINSRSEPLDSKIHFMLWSSPANNDASIITHPNISIIGRIRPDSVNASSDVPPGYPSYTVSNIYYSAQNATNTGKRWADWFEYQGLTKGNGSAYGGLYAGGVFAQNWGTNQNGWSPKSLMADPADAVGGGYVGFHANSTLRNQGTLGDGSLTLGDFIKVAFESMKTECDNRNLCYPLFLAWDLEQTIDGAGVVGSGSVPWISAMADSRFNTEIVYEDWNGSSWVGKTLADAHAAAGYPGHNPSAFWFQSTNQTWMNKMSPYYAKINDHAFSKALYEPAKEVFPYILCGNYNIFFGMSSTQSNQFWQEQNNWWRYPVTDFTYNRHLKADYSSPVCYSPNVSDSLYTRYGPSFNVPYPAGNWGHIFGDNTRDIYRNYTSQIVRCCTSLNNPIPCIPWIEPPYQDSSGWLFPTYQNDATDILYMLKQHYLSGVRTWILFNTTAGDNNTKIYNLNAFVEVLEEFKTWIRTQDKIARVRLTS